MLDSSIISAIKRTFSRSKFAKEYKERCTVKGKLGKRGGKIGECSICKDHIPLYKLSIDHVDPIVPVMIAAKYMSFIMLFKRTFCNESNLQILCSECHTKKSKKEQKQRVKWRKKKKYLVCRSIYGSLIKVFYLSNLKELGEKWEIMNVYTNKKDAENKAKQLRKL